MRIRDRVAEGKFPRGHLYYGQVLFGGVHYWLDGEKVYRDVVGLDRFLLWARNRPEWLAKVYHWVHLPCPICARLGDRK